MHSKNFESAPASSPPNSFLRALTAFHAHEINLAPSLALCVPIFAVFMGLAAGLEYYILHHADHSLPFLAMFFVGSYIVFSSYFVANHYMSTFSKSYASIPDDKKFYVLSNLIKSAALLAYTPSCAGTLWLALVRDVWSTPRIRALGVLYAIPDAISMLLVSRMALSTKIHHACVVLFMAVNLVVTYENETVGRALVVYAVFSTFAYLVNLLLATRFLPVSRGLSVTLSALALLIYGSCLGINWTWQLRFLAKLLRSPALTSTHLVAIVVYCLLMSMVVLDDVVLIKWLWRNVKQKSSEALSPARPTPSASKASKGKAS